MTAPRRALIVVDVQQEYFNGILQIQAPSREKTLANIVGLLLMLIVLIVKPTGLFGAKERA